MRKKATWGWASTGSRRIMELADGVIKLRAPPLPRPHARRGGSPVLWVPKGARELPEAEEQWTSHHQSKNCAFDLPHWLRLGGHQ